MKKYFLVFLLAELLLGYVNFAYAADPTQYDYATQAGVSSQIKQFLCAPTDGGGSYFSLTSGAQNNTAQNDLYNCINRLYKFAIIIAAVVGVFFVVVAGYLYISSDGNPETVTKAKSYITGTLASLVILFIGYILLNAINPDLIQFRSIQPPSVKSTTPLVCPAGSIANANGACQLPNGQTVSPVTSSGVCQPLSSGIASPAALQSTCLGSHATYASMIAKKESGGNSTIPSGVDICLDQSGNKVPNNGKYSSLSKYASVSWGLFQINISAHQVAGLNCPSAFSNMYTAKVHTCSITNQTLYDQCVGAAINAATNIQTACQLSNNGQNWGAWVNECGPVQ